MNIAQQLEQRDIQEGKLHITKSMPVKLHMDIKAVAEGARV